MVKIDGQSVMTKKERLLLPDVLKAIAIISVVIGHAVAGDHNNNELEKILYNFVYTYHLPLFFFEGGYLYKQKKPRYFFKSLIKNNYIPFVAYSFLALLFLPGLVQLHALEESALLVNPKRYAAVLFLRSRVPLTGAMWFVPFYVLSFFIFYVISFIPNEKMKRCIIFMLGCAGAVLTNIHRVNVFYCNRAFLMQPIIWLGYVYRRHEDTVQKYLNRFLWLPIAVVLFLIYPLLNIGIDLAFLEIAGGWLFYPIVLLGIAMCLSFSKNIKEPSKIAHLLQYIGENTFAIMALHFIAFKYMDGLLGLLGFGTAETLYYYPTTFHNVVAFVGYVVIGVGVPLAIKKVIKQLKEIAVLVINRIRK